MNTVGRFFWALAALVPASAWAQSAAVSNPAAPSSSASSCVLRVWSDPSISNTYFGFGGAVGASEQRNLTDSLKAGESSVTEKLTTDALILAAIRKSKLMSEFALSPDAVKLENDPSLAKNFFNSTASNGSNCEFGIEFTGIWFSKDAVWGRELTLFYKIIDRSQPGRRPLRWSWYNSVKIKKFDNTLSNSEISAVIEEALQRVIDEIVSRKVTPKRALNR